MKINSTVLWLFLSVYSCLAQRIEPSTYQETPAVFKSLLAPNNLIAENDSLNELIIDLVVPVLTDSTIGRKKQHHKIGPIGWTIHAFGGFNWRAMSLKKEKFVGTVTRLSRSGKEQYTEYDINFDLNFHLPKYLHRVFDAYDRQGKIKRQDITSKHKRDYKAVPFVRDTNNIDIRQYRLHCELTPERAFRGQLNYLFYPTLPEAGGLKGHPNFETEHPTVGFYGVFCLDCNHSCHPEIHPYEWMWWLKCREGDSSTVKEWNLGIFHEGSNRMKNWSVNPVTGQIRIPFAFDTDKPFRIEIEHGVMNEFVEDGLAGFPIPATNFSASEEKRSVSVKGTGISKNIELHFINPISTKGLTYWFDGLNYDAENHILSGFLYYAVSVKDLYTCRVRFVN